MQEWCYPLSLQKLLWFYTVRVWSNLVQQKHNSNLDLKLLPDCILKNVTWEVNKILSG